MKILFIAPLTRNITPGSVAGRPRMVFDLISGLIKKGHTITVIGTKDSFIPKARIIPVIEKGFYEISDSFENPFYAHTAFLTIQAKVMEKSASNFDIIHNHSYPECINLLTEKNINIPIISTLHSALSEELDTALSFFKRTKIICASSEAAKGAKKAKIYKVIHHGVDTDLFVFSPKKESYLLWIGRLSKAKDKNGDFMDPKGVKWAIQLAKKTGSELKLVANVEDIEFFNKEVRPHLSEKITWIGGISKEPPLSKEEVSGLMQKAKVLLMTARFKEAFGLVVAEAQSCGTPVIGFKQGPVSEIIINNKTGFITDMKQGVAGLEAALNNISMINPKDCRLHIEENFSLKKMIDSYEEAYVNIIKEHEA